MSQPLPSPDPEPTADVEHLVLYDGVCGLCDRAIQLLLRIDRHARLQFAPLQGETARRVLGGLGIRNEFETLVYVRRPDSATPTATVRSTAVLGLLHTVGGVWRAVALLRFVPRPIRDAVYRVVARYRYRVFGRFDSCRLPSPETRARFLD